MIILFIKLVTGTSADTSDIDFVKPSFSMSLLANIPTIFLAYGFQTAFFPVFESLKERTERNGIKITLMSFASCFILYIAISIVAIFVFGSDLKSDVMENVSAESDPLSYILQFLFLVISSMHIPIVLFVGKEAVLIIFDECMRRSISSAKDELRKSLNIEVGQFFR